MNARMLKLVLAGYLVKSLLLALAWLFVPDLPQRAATGARRAWGAVAGSAEP